MASPAYGAPTNPGASLDIWAVADLLPAAQAAHAALTASGRALCMTRARVHARRALAKQAKIGPAPG